MSTSESLISHLIELRTRLMRIFAAIVVVFLCFAPWSRELYTFLAHPLLAHLPKGGSMIATEVTTPFLVPMKIALMASFLVTLPHTLYQLWAFVAPGLYSHEKKLVAPLIVGSTFLFFCGMSFAYFLVFPVVFGFITKVTPEGVSMMTDIGKYLDFVLTLFIAFGVTFEVPIIVIILVRMGFIEVKKLKEIRPYFVVCAFVIGALFTPPDVVSQTMLALPLWLLYELGIFLARFTPKPAEDLPAGK
ncbi:MAG: twin-arginine translocase subunit TatC [Burkholderiales bacterium]|nr:twin-arginine translocase subunit TatC [Burkholderiales bacterium]